MNPILYLAGPYPGHREIPLAEIVGVAEFHCAAAQDAGWRPLCPSLWPEAEAWRSGEEMIRRLDPDYDAMMMLPGWIRDQRAITERRRASVRRIPVYFARDGDEHPVPPVEGHELCPHFREVHYEIRDYEMCTADLRRCPRGAKCPIWERVRGQKAWSGWSP